MTDHDRTAFDRTWNPLIDPDAPLGGECHHCGETGQLSCDSYEADPTDTFCENCGGTGRTPPWGKVPCPIAIHCQECGGTGFRPLRVLVDLENSTSGEADLFSPRAIRAIECSSFMGELAIAGTAPFSDKRLAHLFATLAATPNAHYTIRTAYLERAKAYINAGQEWHDGQLRYVGETTPQVVSHVFGILGMDDDDWPGWPLPNVTIEAVGA